MGFSRKNGTIVSRSSPNRRTTNRYHVLPMVVVAAIRVDLAASEAADEIFEDIAARSALRDGELRSDLPSQRHLAAPVDGAAEATFPIHEPHDPSDGRESFLLVFRTSHIVTAVHRSRRDRATDTTSSGGSTGFSSI